MISAVADSCSVRLDKVNGKVYRFHALVFNPGKIVFSVVIAQFIIIFPETRSLVYKPATLLFNDGSR